MQAQEDAVNSPAALMGVVKRHCGNTALDGGSLNIECGNVTALPMLAGVLLATKLVTAMVFAHLVSIVLMLLAASVGKVMLELVQWASLLVLVVLGVVPFDGFGLLMGTLAKGHAVPAVLNLIGVPMSLLAGLWGPLSVLPHSLAQLAPLVGSAYHWVKLGHYVVDERGVELLPHVLDLVGMTVVSLVIAPRASRWVR